MTDLNVATVMHLANQKRVGWYITSASHEHHTQNRCLSNMEEKLKMAVAGFPELDKMRLIKIKNLT